MNKNNSSEQNYTLQNMAQNMSGFQCLLIRLLQRYLNIPQHPSAMQFISLAVSFTKINYLQGMVQVKVVTYGPYDMVWNIWYVIHCEPY